MTIRFCYIAISDAFFTIFYVCYVTHARLRSTLYVFYVGILWIPHYVEPILYFLGFYSFIRLCLHRCIYRPFILLLLLLSLTHACPVSYFLPVNSDGQP